MPYLTVNLTPPLTGALGTLYLTYEGTIYPIIDLPPSDAGVISTFITVSAPESDYFVLFPEQTVEGIPYAEAASSIFNLITNIMIGVTLTPKAITPLPVSGLGVLVAVAAALFIFGKK